MSALLCKPERDLVLQRKVESSYVEVEPRELLFVGKPKFYFVL